MRRRGRPDRSARKSSAVAELHDDDFKLHQVPETAIEVDGKALDCVLACLGISEDRVRRLFAAEEHDRGAVVARPLRCDLGPVDALAPIDFGGANDASRTPLALKFDERVVRAIWIELDLNHCRLTVAIRDHHDALGVPGERCDLRANTEVIVHAADTFGALPSVAAA